MVLTRLRDKIRSQKGETLIETLFGVLIVAMASAIIFAGVAASVRVNQEAREKRNEQQKFTYEDNAPSLPDGTISVSGSGNPLSITVKEHRFQNDDGEVIYVWYGLE